MSAPVKLWTKADLLTRQLLQRMVFSNGIVYDLKEKMFGTNETSPLYSVNFTKKEPNGSEKTKYGARDWTRTSTHEAYAPKAYVYTNFTTRACVDYNTILGILES